MLSTLDNMVRNDGVDPQTGMGPIIWNAWETTWTGFLQLLILKVHQLQHHQNDTVTWSEGGWVNGEPDTNPARWVTATVRYNNHNTGSLQRNYSRDWYSKK